MPMFRRTSSFAFKLVYLLYHMANLDQISCKALSGGGKAAYDFGADVIGILISMATYSSHRLKWERLKNLLL